MSIIDVKLSTQREGQREAQGERERFPQYMYLPVL